MRLNVFLAQHTDLSRRKADDVIAEGRVEINGTLARLGDTVIESDRVTLDGQPLEQSHETQTLILHKPAGYICSRNGQGSRTVYELLPEELRHLNPVGRLDKDSSGLLLMTNDGQLANELTHPRYAKVKKYQVRLRVPLEPLHQQMISDHGVQLEDGPSRLQLTNLADSRKYWEVSMQEGRNRQIRRTFSALGYTVTRLHRTNFGPYAIDNLKEGTYKVI